MNALQSIFAAAQPVLRSSSSYTIIDLLTSMDWYQREPHAWTAWRAFLSAVFGLPMSPEELAIYRECTGRRDAPTAQADEVYLIAGRRGGKTRIAGLIATYLAGCRDYSTVLNAPGQWGTIPLIAADMAQARELMAYIKGNFEHPSLSHLIDRALEEELRLKNRVRIEIHTASFRSTRGYTILAALADEIAFWDTTTTAANPDREVLNAIRPGMVSVPGKILLALSSPYAQRGVLWDAFKKHYGQSGRVLVWRAPTLTMHPDPHIAREVTQAYQDDPARATAEFGANFRPDVDTFVTDQTVDACMKGQPSVRPPVPGVQYFAFTDPSGGSSDSYVTAISHYDHDAKKPTLDCIMETLAPFQPTPVVKQHSDTLKVYGITWTEGDKYAGEWPRDAYRQVDIAYRHSERPKSQIYVDCLPHLQSGNAALLSNDRLRDQLVGLDRKTSRAGRDSIDHEDGANDDVANAACGALLLAAEIGSKMAPPEKPKPAGTPEEQRLAAIWQRVREENRPEEDVSGPARYGGGW